jgi:glycosyltransferase involved in cell wall biosynthesis
VPPALAPIAVGREAIERARSRHGLREKYVLYPGDLEFGNGAATFVSAAARAKDIDWVVAARPKTPRAIEARARLEAEADAVGARIVWLGEVDDIHAIVAGARVVALVSDTLHAKMDWPLVLLEALALRVPVLVAEGTAAAELDASGGAVCVRSGDAEALVRAVRDAWREEGIRSHCEAAARWVAETCAPGVVARAHEALYDELLGRS